MNPYNFYTQRAIGHAGEAVICDWLNSQGWQLRPATDAEQRQGIDFWGCFPSKGATSFEIKTDRRAHRSGNAFIELESSNKTGKLGWLFTCEADVILYWIPGLDLVLWMQPDNIRNAYQDWKDLYSLRQIPNDGYYTTGLIVPLESFQTAATYTYHLWPQLPPAA